MDDILAQYGFDDCRIRPLRRAFVISARGSLFSLKKFPFKKKELDLIVKALIHLTSKGFTKKYDIFPTKDGRWAAEKDQELWLMTTWVDGHDCRLNSDRDVSSAVNTIGEFHSAALGFDLKDQSHSGRDEFGLWPDMFRKKADDISMLKTIVKADAKRNRFDRAFLRFADRCLDSASESLQILSCLDYSKAVDSYRAKGFFCHGDLSSKNILVTNEISSNLIDMDRLLLDLPHRDIGIFIRRVMEIGGWNVRTLDQILKTYEKVFPFSKADHGILIAYLIFPHEFWRIATQKYSERLGWSERRFSSRLWKIAGNINAKDKCLKELIFAGR